jgi:hypothetical protein
MEYPNILSLANGLIVDKVQKTAQITGLLGAAISNSAVQLRGYQPGKCLFGLPEPEIIQFISLQSSCFFHIFNA